MSQRKAKQSRQQQRSSTAIDRGHIAKLHQELTEQYEQAVMALDHARANANAIKGAMQFAVRLLNMPAAPPPVELPPPIEPPAAPPIEPPAASPDAPKS